MLVFQLDAAQVQLLQDSVPAPPTFNAAQRILARHLREPANAFRKALVPVHPTSATAPVHQIFNAVLEAQLFVIPIVARHWLPELNRLILFTKIRVILSVAQAHGQLILMDIVELAMAISTQIISAL